MAPYKSNTCYAMLDAWGFADAAYPGVAGVMLDDTRHISDYAWDFEGFELSESEATTTSVRQFWSRFVRHEQDVLIERHLTFRPDGFDDVLTVTNETLDVQSFVPNLTADADFVDAFELRGRERQIGKAEVRKERRVDGASFAYRAQDGIEVATDLRFEGFRNGNAVSLAPGQPISFAVNATFRTSLTDPQRPAPSVEWSAVARSVRTKADAALERALQDIEALVVSTPHGAFPIAGVPNFVCPFGRDALITSLLLLPATPPLAAATLRLLADYQGTKVDPAREEEPGKIAHEIRVSELARSGDVPFARYYGTTDATPLFVILLRDYVRLTGTSDLAKELGTNWRAALGWIEAQQDETGLIRYAASRTGRGLVHTSWKDSDDSVSYADGRLATGRIAVVEIQGYAAAAFEAAADLNAMTGGKADQTVRLRAKAAAMRLTIDDLFWNDRIGLHAIAVDADGHQCDTATSNPGHLLWMGCLGPGRAHQVADRMMQPDLWSGWGLRTLSTREKRYKPLSYHNGSVWPHDTGIFAMGLRRYGIADHERTVISALHDLAARQPRLQLPELLGGYARDSSVPPHGYTETCRPQAWAAAALISTVI
jgi:glycogen debranching enzyme